MLREYDEDLSDSDGIAGGTRTTLTGRHGVGDGDGDGDRFIENRAHVQDPEGGDMGEGVRVGRTEDLVGAVSVSHDPDGVDMDVDLGEDIDEERGGPEEHSATDGSIQQTNAFQRETNSGSSVHGTSSWSCPDSSSSNDEDDDDANTVRATTPNNPH
uniref:Uncharacterized protein n=1 Tax=Proboscia inermis TaxID=420281 RepID=A0A7S0CCG6_9STRA|mmetsp:Transcript_39404/g.39931  ORF Transcript_39404/g.39931 Transcript_39404/m.39931 type:complete len:157 (+) Transcript_39404:294-764(+)